MLAPEIDSTSIQSMLFTYLQVKSETNKKLITQYYCNLLELITHNFSNINIIMSAILPRPIDFDTTKQLVIEAMKVNEKSCLSWIEKLITYPQS
jgi:hypothetical protein